MRYESFKLPVGETINALTVWQPWATLLTRKEKKYETRGWKPSLDTGDLLALHSAKKWDENSTLHKTNPEIRTALTLVERLPPDFGQVDQCMPRGRVLAVARFAGAFPTGDYRDTISDRERALGDWSDGRWAWGIKIEYIYGTPVPTRGNQGLWEWEVQKDPAKS